MNQAIRMKYLAQSVETASPAQLVVMLYNALVKDLLQAERAIGRDDGPLAHESLVHAQDIVSALRGTLDLDAWDGARNLASLYDYLLEQMVAANIGKDADLVKTCRELVEPLRDAWREAALAVGRGQDSVPGAEAPDAPSR